MTSPTKQGIELLRDPSLNKSTVSTVRFELEQVRPYIREQEEADGTGGQF